MLVVTSGTGDALATILKESRGNLEVMVEHEEEGASSEPLWSPPVVIEREQLEWECPHIARYLMYIYIIYIRMLCRVQ